ncbi:MAG TPA: sulfatase-like hydrolase/transferase [Planctomycetota bacterium]|nr:sulfatase-like hydrolase/transferase [Planctomycetota bacterium]
MIASNPEVGTGTGASPRRRVLFTAFWLFTANAIAAWLINLGVIRHHAWSRMLGDGHFLLAYLSHLALVSAALCAPFAAAGALAPRLGRALFLWALPPVLAAAHFVFVVDGIVYGLVRFHLNPAVLDFLTTPGLKDNIQLSPWQVTEAVLILAGLALAEHVAARVLWNSAAEAVPTGRPGFLGRLGSALRRRLPDPGRLRRHAVTVLVALAVGVLAEKALYAWADIRGVGSVLVNAAALPFYPQLTCQRLARTLGIRPEPRQKLAGETALRYPLAPLVPPENPRRLNVVWIAVEEWRSDMFTPEITPRVWRFGQRGLTAERHYSSGNASRHGIFGLFYGLHGFYWDSFLAERRGPVLFPALQQMGYEVRAMGSASLDNPEFRLTCFSGLSAAEVLDRWKPESLDSASKDFDMAEAFAGFLAGRDPQRPFFAFVFLDSPHSKRFKPLPGFEPPFPVDDAAFVSYERLAGDKREQARTLLRYKNSLAYADFLIGRALEDLERRKLLENTVVVITGDHGEEFGEGGFYGHNGSFNDWQTRVPFVLYYPGVRPGRIAGMTAHQDVLPTTLGLLGFTADPAGYCLGRDMLGAGARDHTVAASWNDAAVITSDGGRVAFPLSAYRLSTLQVYDGAGRPLPDRDAFLAANAARLSEALESARRFRR